MDTIDKSKRSEIMSKIRSANTKPELLVRKWLFSKGFRYRINDKRYQGKPDIVLPKYKTIIFINGCFWHGHKNCQNYRLPKTQTEFWSEKINKNIKRDAINHENLINSGWSVIIIWECQLKKDFEMKMNDLVKQIKKSKIGQI